MWWIILFSWNVYFEMCSVIICIMKKCFEFVLCDVFVFVELVGVFDVWVFEGLLVLLVVVVVGVW